MTAQKKSEIGFPSLLIRKTDLKSANPIRLLAEADGLEAVTTDGAMAAAFGIKPKTDEKVRETLGEWRSARSYLRRISAGKFRDGGTDLILKKLTDKEPVGRETLGYVSLREDACRSRLEYLSESELDWEISDRFMPRLQSAIDGRIFEAEVHTKEGDTVVLGPCFSEFDVLDVVFRRFPRLWNT